MLSLRRRWLLRYPGSNMIRGRPPGPAGPCPPLPRRERWHGSALNLDHPITWLIPGQATAGRGSARVTPATLAYRLGTLRMFFVRIGDWDWPDAPARVPIIPADLPRQDH